ncbi:hypothetical protein GEV29_00815 [Aeromicrobium sp. SMF47]|uniref:Uncharacterized protein n=1 Tax=Aeromicrobium yanjiei TaxID=2662028 RepID=A0A5Q2MBI0_9ACTN|nr:MULTISPECIES: hypothetical protein [Aeromicrobium]MRJ75070.1 hypothetical protein [Aeromicrobium yanjiei]MRK02874.1 hypothetical protein [Aeromicrobium sp. S22]QGG40444.1 hypothetical protein GEV26_03145 [Aeromicrobium yanjiei]
MKIALALLASVLLLTGCSGSDSDGAQPFGGDAPRTQPQEQAEQQEKAQKELGDAERGTVVEVAIKDGTVVPQGERVEVGVGEKVTLEVSSDAAEEIHVHSDPEHTFEVPAGGAISETFSVDTPGQVAVEAHHLGATIVQLVVRP